MRRKNKASVPVNITEQYYQLTAEVLNSFPKYRLPIGLYVFEEKIATLAPYSRHDQRLTNEQVAEVQVLCQEGRLFVARSDFPIYSEHIVKQLDLVLQDESLKDSEVAELSIRAVTGHLKTFIESPVKVNFDPLYAAVMVVTEWLWQEQARLYSFSIRLLKTDDLAKHSFNTMIVGLLIWRTLHSDTMTRRQFDRVVLALLLHDVGMSKIPQFVLKKSAKLSPDEQGKVKHHPVLGYKIMQKMDLTFDELAHCLMEHHERLDGSGYPRGTKGSSITELGRICAVADSFCSMVADRSHSPARSLEEAVKELKKNDSLFDGIFISLILAAITNKEIRFCDEKK